MNDNFDEELTVTLRERAGAVPPRTDLAGAAIRQAHGIRRRRRVRPADKGLADSTTLIREDRDNRF